jgi:phosphoribosylanthranilate isomerase
VKTFVKICGIRDAGMAAAAATAGANAIGFVFAESPRRVTLAEAAAAAAAIPDGVIKVAVMRHPSSEDLAAVLEGFSPDVLQTDASDFASLAVPADVVCWPVLREGTVAARDVPRDIFVYEGVASGSGQTVDWSRAAAIARQGRMILAGGLAPANVAAAISAVRPWGVDVSSGVERERGQKDADLIREFIGAVRAAENVA